VRIVVTGGRNYSDSRAVYRELDKIHKATPITELLHGAYSGADTLADKWARSRGVQPQPMPAEWSRFGRSAGPRRNTKMLARRPDLVVAFPGGDGTADCVGKARALGITVIEVK